MVYAMSGDSEPSNCYVDTMGQDVVMTVRYMHSSKKDAVKGEAQHCEHYFLLHAIIRLYSVAVYAY